MATIYLALVFLCHCDVIMENYYMDWVGEVDRAKVVEADYRDYFDDDAG